MKLPQKPSRVVQVGPETVVFADGGEEWCLFDEPRLQTSPGDWGRLQASDCQTTDFCALVLELERWRDGDNGKPTHAPAYQLFASTQFREQLRNIYAANSPKTRAEILLALQETQEQLRADPLSDSRFEFDLPAQGWQVRSTWPLPLVIHFAVDVPNHAVYFHSVKDSSAEKS